MKTSAFLLLAGLLLLAAPSALADLPPEPCDPTDTSFENCPPESIGGPRRARVCGLVNVDGQCFPL